MVTSAKEWAKTAKARFKGAELELSTGQTVVVRNIPMSMFLRYGDIPNELSGIVSELAGGKTVSSITSDIDQTKKFYDLLDLIASFAILEPKVVIGEVEPDTEKGEIHVSWIEEDDKWLLLRLLELPARELEKFCQEQADTLESLRSEQESESETEPLVESDAVLSEYN